MTMLARLAALFMLCLSMAAPAVSHAEPVSRLLAIGCDSFVNWQDTAPASANNAHRMAKTLESGAKLQQVTISVSGLSDEEGLQQLLDKAFAGADDDDISYLYISTHGQWQPGQAAGEMALVLSDGKNETLLTAWQLRDMLDKVPGTKVLLVDACHSGAMLGKGTVELLDNVFEGHDYKVICSSGGAEESWFWAGNEATDAAAAAGYFSDAVTRALGYQGTYPADDDGDGHVTLTELKRWLRMYHGVSTVQTYPEEDDFVLVSYDPAQPVRSAAVVDNLVFEDDVLDPDAPEAAFSFTVRRETRLACQLVLQEHDRWNFAGAAVLWDNSEATGLFGDVEGALSPGYKERTLSLDVNDDEDSYGYALLQLVTVTRGVTEVAGSHVLCMPPRTGDLKLKCITATSFTPKTGSELPVIIQHELPCAITVTIENEQGDTVRRLASRTASRPEQLQPAGSTFAWNGRDADGKLLPQGTYTVHVKAWIGSGMQEAFSQPFELK